MHPKFSTFIRPNDNAAQYQSKDLQRKMSFFPCRKLRCQNTKNTQLPMAKKKKNQDKPTKHKNKNKSKCNKLQIQRKGQEQTGQGTNSPPRPPQRPHPTSRKQQDSIFQLTKQHQPSQNRTSPQPDTQNYIFSTSNQHKRRHYRTKSSIHTQQQRQRLQRAGLVKKKKKKEYLKVELEMLTGFWVCLSAKGDKMGGESLPFFCSKVLVLTLQWPWLSSSCRKGGCHEDLALDDKLY